MTPRISFAQTENGNKAAEGFAGGSGASGLTGTRGCGSAGLKNAEPLEDKDDTLIADTFELTAGKSISSLTLLEAPEFGNTDCTVTITAYRDSKEIGSMQTELTLHTAYLWPKEVQ